MRWTWKLQHLENCHHLPLGEEHWKNQQDRSSMGSEFKKKKCWQLPPALCCWEQQRSSWRGRLWALTNPSWPLTKAGVHIPSGSNGHRSPSTFTSFCSHLFRSLTMAGAHQVPQQERERWLAETSAEAFSLCLTPLAPSSSDFIHRDETCT